MATNKLQWKRIAKGEKLPCTAMLMKEDGTMTSMVTDAGVTVGQDAYYLPLDELRKLPKEESEDERIRKEILALIEWSKSYAASGITTDEEKEMIAWLKKQCEQKTSPIFEVGDVMRTKEEATKGLKSGMPVVVSIDKEYYHCNNELIAIKDQYDYEYPPMNRRQKPAWSKEDEKMLVGCVQAMCTPDAYSLNDRINFEYWLKSIKDRVYPQPKQELNKDGEGFYYRTIGLLEQYTNSDIEVKKQNALSCINWLKSVIKQEKIIKYKIGDRVRFFSHSEIFKISDIDEVNERYISTTGDPISFYEELIPAKSSINRGDIKCGDYLTTEDGTVIKVHDVDENERVHYFYYSKEMTEDGGDISSNFMYYCAILCDCRRATQEEIDFLEKWVTHKKYVWIEDNVSPDDEEDD